LVEQPRVLAPKQLATLDRAEWSEHDAAPERLAPGQRLVRPRRRCRWCLNGGRGSRRQRLGHDLLGTDGSGLGSARLGWQLTQALLGTPEQAR
jgi:hypothetical protein